MADRPEGGRAVAAWGVIGVVVVLGQAVLALGVRGVATVRAGLSPVELAALLALLVAFVYGEGVRGLQRRWIPYVVRRIQRLRTERHAAYRLLAPLYAMGLVGGPRRELLRAWAGVAAIGAAVLVVRALPEPWRGIVDLAVAAALAWGVAAMVVQSARAL